MAEAEYYAQYDGTYVMQRSNMNWRPTPYMPAEVIDFNDPEQVATCLIDNGDYNGHQLMAAHSDTDIRAFALEDALRIIANRDELLHGRKNIQLQLQHAMARAAVEDRVRTVYVVTASAAG